jgi:predicted transcriptional regulator
MKPRVNTRVLTVLMELQRCIETLTRGIEINRNLATDLVYLSRTQMNVANRMSALDGMI